MKALLLVALGGAFGSMARYQLSQWILISYAQEWRFPAGTFAVNVLGCLVAGLLAGLVERSALLSADIKLLLFVGVLGGFTTFSAFGLETVQLLRRGEIGIAGTYVVLSVIIGMAVLWLGFLATAPRS